MCFEFSFVLTHLVQLQVWCRQCGSCWWGQPGRSHHMGRMWTPAGRKHHFQHWGGNSGESEPMVFQLWHRTWITHRVPPGLQQSQFPGSETDVNSNEDWWVVVKRPVRVQRGYLHGFILTVGTQVDRWAVSELDHDAILSGVALRWSHVCSTQVKEVIHLKASIISIDVF